jgi:tRNA (guanine37-N1)-methyltransferase
MTLFPDVIEAFLGSGVIGRAAANGVVTIYSHNIRDYSGNKHKKVDDTPYGGGRGMLMAAPPIYECYKAISGELDKAEIPSEKRRVIYMSPKGRVFTQAVARELTDYESIILLCGHYEGIDQRIIDEIVDEELSLGDFVLTGGEIPACAVADSVLRLCEGVLPADECFEIESFSDGLLEFPQYTRPYEFLGKRVPDVLLSGNHAYIEKWRREAALKETKEKRSDLLESINE